MNLWGILKLLFGPRRKRIILEHGRSFCLMVPFDNDMVTAKKFYDQCVSSSKHRPGRLIELATLKSDIPAIAISGVWNNNDPDLPMNVIRGCDVGFDNEATTVRISEYFSRVVRIEESILT